MTKKVVIDYDYFNGEQTDYPAEEYDVIFRSTTDSFTKSRHRFKGRIPL